ncbi:hypothetical protein LINPERHAP2_LOCUS453, partial [Linum perenne]
DSPPPLPHHLNASRPSPGFPLGTYGSATDRHLRLERYLLQLIPLGQAPLSSPLRRSFRSGRRVSTIQCLIRFTG